MAYYRIAELTVEMEPRYDMLKRQVEKYEIPPLSGEPDIRLKMSDEWLAKKRAESPHLSMDGCEYIWTGVGFSSKLWQFDALVMHASALALDGKAYLFSAASGVGKTTHTKLWQQLFPDAFIIDDDHPVIRLQDGVLMVHGTPFSGNSEENRNVKLPLAAITFLQRDSDNWIRRADAKEAVGDLMQNISRTRQAEAASVKLMLMDRIAKDTLLCKMGCTIDQKAAETAYQFIKENQR